VKTVVLVRLLTESASRRRDMSGNNSAEKF
jgi:hypothetical protein